jgi:hypothetical protein
LTKAAVLTRDDESTACIGLTALLSEIVDFKEEKSEMRQYARNLHLKSHDDLQR